MQKNIFSRYERKYVISTKQKNEIITKLNEYLVDDPFSMNGSNYTIYNIYFDTADYSLIRNSIQKPIYKDKLRLRSYKSPVEETDLVFLEIKKKYEGRVNKRRVILSYKDAMNYIDNRVMPVFTNYIEKQIMSEIDYLVKTHDLKPGSFIRYDRIALMTPDDQLRITFDHNIIFRNENLHINDKSGFPVLSEPDVWLMEVKSEDNFPLWLVKVLSEYQLYSQSFSKYGKAYQKHLLGGSTDDPILYQY
jgi:SPX domain protein involved in polyphosphate accumulation